MTAKIHTPVCMIGAGPAGLMAALTLARAGKECLIIDRSTFPREKICGDGVSGKFLATLELIDPGLAQELCRQDFVTPSYGVRFFSPAGKSALISFSPEGSGLPPGLICKRREFDNFFVSKLKTMPEVHFIEGRTVMDVKFDDDGAEIITDSDNVSLRADLVLCATGSSRINGITSAGNSSGGLGVRAYFENVPCPGPVNAIEIHFLKELLPWYFWIFPFKDGSANAGLALPLKVIREKRIRLENLFNEVIGKYPYLRYRFKDARISGSMAAAPLEIYQGAHAVSGHRFMLLGDAARLTDPFTGEGIGNAAYSGRMAALTALECLAKMDFSADSTLEYAHRLDHGLREEFELDQRLCDLAHNKSLLNLVIGRASRSKNIRRLIGRMLYDSGTKDHLRDQLFYLKLLLHLKI